MQFLSVIIPVRNEAKHIADVLDRLLDQDYDRNRFEILVVDGLSEDETQKIVRKYAETNDNIRLLENPRRLSSAARNIGVRNACGDVVLIVDGHCLIENREMLKNVDRAFETTGADCLGRPQPLEMKDATRLQWAIASARRSPLGHHPDSFIYSNEGRFSPAISVAIAYKKEVFERVGPFDESFDACEDVELNHRIDQSGLRCYFDPSIAVYYVPRRSLSGLFHQMNRYGRGRVRLFRKHPETFSLKSFGLGFFVLGVLLGPLLYLFPPFALKYLALIYAAVIISYFLAVFGESIRLALKTRRPSLLPLLPFVFLAIHFGFGFGILREFCRRRQ